MQRTVQQTPQRLHITAATVKKLPFVTDSDVSPTTGKPITQKFYRDDDVTGFGLVVGRTAKTFIAEKRVDGRNVRFTLGRHGQITADEARKKAATALGVMTDGKDLNRLKQAKVVERKVEKERKAASARYTVQALCEKYIEHQVKSKRQSAKDAAGIFKKWIYTSKFAGFPARDLTGDDAAEMINVIFQAGFKRTAAKARSYLSAAYALATNKIEATEELKAFGIKTNPVAGFKMKSYITGRKVPLTEEELGETLRLLRARRKTQHHDALAAFELSILLGGQRIAQVLRLTATDVDMDARTVTLLDTKGRNRQDNPYRHVVPLTDAAVKLLEDIYKARGNKLFGDAPLGTATTVLAREGSKLLAQAQEAIKKRSKDTALPRPKIEPRDVRTTAETTLAALGIQKDVRAQLLSHGLGGAQDTHYDAHDYLDKKRNALEAWSSHIEALVDRKAMPSNVKRLKRAG